MDSANKAISFVLGLVVVIVFLAVITGRFKFKPTAFLPLTKKTTLTPTPSPTPKTTIISSVNIPLEETSKINTYRSSNLKSIPATGAPTILLPLALSSLIGGIYLKKKS